MIIKPFALSLVLLLFMVACSSNNTMQYFKKNKHFQKAMSSLQIGTLVDGLDTKAVFKAIYLNKTFKDEYQNGENFYISTFIDKEPYAKDKRGLFNKLFTLKLNGKKPIIIKELDSDDLLRMQMPLVERWSKYYYVKFDKSRKKNLILTFSQKHQGTITLKYDK